VAASAQLPLHTTLWGPRLLAIAGFWLIGYIGVSGSAGDVAVKQFTTCLNYSVNNKGGLMSKNSLLTFRLANTADYTRFAALISHVEGRTITGDTLQSWDAHKIEDDIFHRYAACLDEEIIGFGNIQKLAVTQFPQFTIWFTIDAPYRSKGYGGQFYDFLAQQAVAYGAEEFISDCKDNDPHSLRFAQKRGFEIRRHAFDSRLDLKTFNPDKLLPIIDEVKAQGIRFTSLAAEGNTEAVQRKLFELNTVTAGDNPSSDGKRRNTFENFKSKVLTADWFRADGQILAVAGDRFVGLSAIGFESDGMTAFNAFTGIDQAYRGRKIAQALRILAAQYAISKGAQVIVTDNDSENAPMLAINDKMGYVRQPGTYWLVKRMLSGTKTNR
jgi:GNAT superfamily N-acetyltransferase